MNIDDDISKSFETIIHLKAQIEEAKKKLLLGHQIKGMKVFFMGIFIHVMDMVTKILNVDLIKGDIMEYSITLQSVGDVIK
jgi:hypothetical protein